MIAAIGAMRIITGDPCGAYYEPRNMPDATAKRFVSLAEQDGLLVDCPVIGCAHTVVLDLYDERGDIVDDRCVVSDQAWLALNSELALREVSR